jgi:carboxyl-terminal processing protease
MTGQFVGIGCQVETRDGWLTVVSPIEDSPAYAAGILAGDRITRIEDTSTMGKGVDECIKLLTGQPKTPVNIIVQRDGKDIPFTIIRDKIVSKSVRGFRRLPDGTGHWDYLLDPERKIAYIRLSQFTPTSGKEMKAALAEVRAQAGELQGLIFDLRNNPGGFMQSALEIADIFLDNVVIMSVRGRDERMNETFEATHSADKPAYPIAVLVNGSSASASEIVSGALQDHARAIVIGERTFGKGLVQSVLPLPHSESAQVKFTTQRYYLPSGRLIQRLDNSAQWGVDPSPGFYVPMSEQDFLAWILHRRDQDILRKDTVPADFGVQKWTDPEWIASSAKDAQLSAALKALNVRLDSGQWARINDTEDAHGKIAEAELRALERSRLRFSREFARIEKRIETLEKQASGGKPPEPKDLWPDALDLTGGSVIVRDKDGNAVANLKITGRDVERWFENADVTLDKPASVPAPTSPTP